MVRALGVDVTLRLFDVDSILEIAVQECCDHVHEMALEAFECGDHK